ncbi:MAG: hypothetical protein EBT13_11095, partial [Rhodobacteraceae bacterium]|nr:hypothetical protein [Paracoccaceae bacterium]
GGDGNDTIWGGLDNDTLLGDAGNDQIGGEEGDDLIKGGAGDDTLTGGIGNDTIYGDELGASGTGLSSVDPVALNFSSVRAGSETTNPNAAVAGSSVIYDNVATLDDGTQVSARMVLVSKSSEHLQVDMANTGDHEILLNANNNSAMQGQTATFRLEFFNTVTGAPVTLEPGIVFADLDANGGSEVITINDANLLNVGVGTGTSLDVAFNPGSVTATGSASGTQDNLDPNELDAQVATVFGSTSQVTFTMTSRAYNSGLNFGTFEGQDFNFLANQDAGNDSILGGDGNDLIYGNAGDDTVSGGAGNDTIYGDDPAGTPNGAGDMKALEWTAFGGNGATVANGASTDVGGVKVTVGFAALDSGATATVSTGTQYREADDAFDNDSALRLYGLGGEGGVDQTSKTTLTFDGTNPIYGDEVADVSFRINDVDVGTSSDPHIDIVTVRAFDADGNEVPVTLTPEGSQTVNGQTVTGTQSHSTGIEPNVQAGSVLVNITGPVARIEVTYANGSTTDQQVTLTDLAFKTTSADGAVAGGDDVLFGNDGADVIFGNGGDDTITGGAGADTLSGNDDRDLFIGGTAGDSVDGGTGGDDFDILDLSNSGPLRIVNETTDTDGDSTSGTVEFLDSNGNVTGTMTFEEIEQIILPPNSGPDAVDDSDTTQEEVPVTLDLLANDSDVDGDPLTVISATVPAAQGTLVDNGDGTVTFTPAPNFTG